MNEKKDDGGPAFPGNQVYCVGMSLRDWFAGQALAGIYASRSGSYDSNVDAYAAYVVADAMLKARAR